MKAGMTVFVFIIADNGMGFDPEVHHQPGSRPEWGLINMRERALSIGGRLQVETAREKGPRSLWRCRNKPNAECGIIWNDKLEINDNPNFEC